MVVRTNETTPWWVQRLPFFGTSQMVNERLFMVMAVQDPPEDLGKTRSQQKALMDVLVADLWSLERYGGHIYQLSGTQLAVVWSHIPLGQSVVRSVRQALNRLVTKRALFYEEAFGFVPRFSSGVACGPFSATTLREAAQRAR